MPNMLCMPGPSPCRQQESLRLLRKQTRALPRLCPHAFPLQLLLVCSMRIKDGPAPHQLAKHWKVLSLVLSEMMHGKLNNMRWNLRQHQHGHKWKRTFEGTANEISLTPFRPPLIPITGAPHHGQTFLKLWFLGKRLGYPSSFHLLG